MKADPKVKRNGNCVVCNQPRRPERSKVYGKDAALNDPFCSMLCCRLWHDEPLPKYDGSEDPDWPKEKAA